MNPFLASAIVLILRWLQIIASRGIISEADYCLRVSGMLDESTAFSERLANHTLTLHGMSDIADKKEVN